MSLNLSASFGDIMSPAVSPRSTSSKSHQSPKANGQNANRVNESNIYYASTGTNMNDMGDGYVDYDAGGDRVETERSGAPAAAGLRRSQQQQASQVSSSKKPHAVNVYNVSAAANPYIDTYIGNLSPTEDRARGERGRPTSSKDSPRVSSVSYQHGSGHQRSPSMFVSRGSVAGEFTNSGSEDRLRR
jgi:hypothetical protein